MRGPTNDLFQVLPAMAMVVLVFHGQYLTVNVRQRDHGIFEIDLGIVILIHSCRHLQVLLLE